MTTPIEGSGGSLSAEQQTMLEESLIESTLMLEMAFQDLDPTSELWEEFRKVGEPEMG